MQEQHTLTMQSSMDVLTTSWFHLSTLIGFASLGAVVAVPSAAAGWWLRRIRRHCELQWEGNGIQSMIHQVFYYPYGLEHASHVVYTHFLRVLRRHAWGARSKIFGDIMAAVLIISKSPIILVVLRKFVQIHWTTRIRCDEFSNLTLNHDACAWL